MRVVVGITGGIAAYKIPALVRLLHDAGHEVQCIATRHALEFVTRTTLETVSQRPLYYDLFERTNEHTTEHVSLKDWADAVIVAPATANIIGKMAHGIADDALSTFLSAAWDKPTLLCPAMNSAMWANPVVAANVAALVQSGVILVGPETGNLACGTTGKGRMTEPDIIFEEFNSHISGQTSRRETLPLYGQRVLVTAGPTYERIDPVRFIGNFSSGKMGVALAQALVAVGAAVDLVVGPAVALPQLAHTTVHTVESANQMLDTTLSLSDNCQAIIMAAAVADYRPEVCATEKMKRQNQETLTLRLVRNPDILATLGARKKAGQCLIGFALETHNELQYAREKLERKNLDYIVLNSLRDAGAGFATDTNKVTIVSHDGNAYPLPLMSKRQVADQIVQHCLLDRQS